MRGSVLILIFASALFGGAWWTQARAAAAPAAARAGVESPAPPVPAPTRKLDEYGNISWNDEKPRLDNFAIELQMQTAAKGYILCYGGKVGREGEARRRCQRAAGYVSAVRSIDAARIVTVDGGFREELTVELWVAPPGLTPPQPSPTVDRSEVRFVKDRAKRRARTKR